MNKKILLGLILSILTVFSVTAEPDVYKLLKDEHIGDFKMDMSGNSVKVKLHCSFKLGKEEVWGADGAYHQTWRCDEQGIRFGMGSGQKGGDKSIEVITITAPSQLKTKQGIHIGSSEQEVARAYAHDKDTETSTKEMFVAGSPYGGLVFQFKDGKVISIFLGASAE